jgi:ADP-glucose pyrophosphorylase
MGIFTFDQQGRIESFEEKPNSERLAAMKASVRTGGTISVDRDKPFIASMGIYLFLARLCCRCWRSPETTSVVS